MTEFCLEKLMYGGRSELGFCNVLRELLDVDGSHNQGDLFLKEFIHSVLATGNPNLENYSFEEKTILVEHEYEYFYRPEDSQDKLKKQRIDIVIQVLDKEGKVDLFIPIEVKVSQTTSDQPDQCDGCIKCAELAGGKNACAYYLTLDGKVPSELSWNRTNKASQDKMVCLSWKTDIVDWLNTCKDKLEPHTELSNQIDLFITEIEKICAAPHTDRSSLELEKKVSEVFYSLADDIVTKLGPPSIKLKQTPKTSTYEVGTDSHKFALQFRYSTAHDIVWMIGGWNGKNIVYSPDIKISDTQKVKLLLKPYGIGTVDRVGYSYNYQEELLPAYCSMDKNSYPRKLTFSPPFEKLQDLNQEGQWRNVYIARAAYRIRQVLADLNLLP